MELLGTWAGERRALDEDVMMAISRVCAAALMALLAACAGRAPGDVAAPAPALSTPAASAGTLLDPERGVLTIGLMPVGSQLAITLYRDGRRRSVAASIGAAGSNIR